MSLTPQQPISVRLPNPFSGINTPALFVLHFEEAWQLPGTIEYHVNVRHVHILALRQHFQAGEYTHV